MLICVTASHKTASFELLERLSIHPTAIAPLIASHGECVQGAVVVATCNRFEAYVDMDEPVTASGPVAVEAALSAIESVTGVAAKELDGSYRVISGPAVAQHLFAVAAGLESVVVGEGEIAGQVRRALVDARQHGTTSRELERLFQRASEAQRGVKNSTALGRAGRSLVRLALDLADSRIADWSTLRVLLVGTGSYAAATLAALRDHGAADIAVYSPSGRGDRFALKHGIRAVKAEAFAYVAAHADLIVTCTSSDVPVVSASVLTSGAALEGELAIPARRLVIDLGLPRNVDPDVAGVAATDLLDLETIRLHAPLEELQATDAARAVVEDAARRFADVGAVRSVEPAVVALRSHVFSLMEAEIARAHARGDEQSEQSLRHLVGVLLHTPTARAHELAAAGRADEYTAALATLFGIDVPAPSAVATASVPGDLAV
ncbi:glutamyl-tRNA reductase [Microbacterium rhizomatis]|uniref:Glutamyl-tRNA reductase n=1 Tax=Microbacterium rhizomatis TaxID=1631477 RepID=A0A5J5J489_9MICO|nr:glutamyl-tRNA reductase [Microbacterium rhizomatis]KAA9108290.1 glutamyl-tRNA reductase [Microbacterium rhizomatis]